MALLEKIDADIKAAMIARDQPRLLALRAVKSAIFIAKSEEGAGGAITEQKELQILSKLIKQRKESAEIYDAQNRPDLAASERAELAYIEKYLPKMMDETELRAILASIIQQTGASSPADMGKVMGIATKQLAGKAENRVVAVMVKELLGAK